MKLAAKCRRLGGNSFRAVGVVAAVFAGLSLAGCGLGPGEDTGEASLLVTKDYGATVLVNEPDLSVNESSNAMRLLDERVELETAYGGGFVQSVDGLSGKLEGGRSFDWFFAVNGIVAERGSAEFPIGDGDKVWWDYRDWTDAMEVGAVVGSYPAPFSTGYSDEDWGVEIDCLDDQRACALVAERLKDYGVSLEGKSQNMVLRVGTWEQVADSPEGKRLSQGVKKSGVFARFNAGTTATPGSEGPSPWRLVGMNFEGEDAADFGPDAGLVAAMRRGNNAPVWLITGGTEIAVRSAAIALEPEYLERRYAAVVNEGVVTSLPVP